MGGKSLQITDLNKDNTENIMMNFKHIYERQCASTHDLIV